MTGSSRRMSGKLPDGRPIRREAHRLYLVPAGPSAGARAKPMADPDDVHAWIDGELPARMAAAVGQCLSRDPQMAARAVAYRAQVDGLHALYDPVLEEPIPPQLLAVLSRRRSEQERMRVRRTRTRMAAVAGIAAAVAMAVVSGGLILDIQDFAPQSWDGDAGFSAAAPGP